MSVTYTAVGWNRQKKIYDLVLLGGASLYLATFAGVGAVVHPNATIETLLIRGFGTLALLMLHIVLAIGPLSRIDRRFLPLLYNRRHFGLATFVAGLAHGTFSLIQFHALGDVDPLTSLLSSNTRFESVSQFPFQLPGLLALLILFLMAATSHDFWLHTFSPRAWKRVHMMVYAAYALLVAHVSLGALQSETSPLLASILLTGMVVVIALHLMAAQRERTVDGTDASATDFVPACDLEAIPESRAKVVLLNGERIAIFRQGSKVSALSNVCRHQNGPLGEGRIIDGCATCPWHGYQYVPDTGISPPPFHDRVPIYATRILNGKVLVNPIPLTEATR